MKFRNQILFLGLLGLLMACLVGGISLFNADRLTLAIDESQRMAEAQEHSQEADMMHDAIRGDVLLAMLGGLNKDAAQLAEAEKGLAEHTATFNKAMASLQGMVDTAATQGGRRRHAADGGQVHHQCGRTAEAGRQRPRCGAGGGTRVPEGLRRTGEANGRAG